MPMPGSWVEHLFAKLTVRYGAAFMRQYDGLDIAIVKGDWAEVLDGCPGASMSYALRYLPSDRPVNALQFRDLCRRAPPPENARLPAPDGGADPQRVREILAAMHDRRSPADISPAEMCARNILRIAADRGGRMSIPQRQQLEAMARLMTPQTRALAAQYIPRLAEHPSEAAV